MTIDIPGYFQLQIYFGLQLEFLISLQKSAFFLEHFGSIQREIFAHSKMHLFSNKTKMSNLFEDRKKAQQCKFIIFWINIIDNQIT